MTSCYTPTKDSNCVDDCVIDGTGFYKDRDGDIFDYEFTTDESNMAEIEGDKTTAGIAGSSLFTADPLQKKRPAGSLLLNNTTSI